MHASAPHLAHLAHHCPSAGPWVADRLLYEKWTGLDGEGSQYNDTTVLLCEVLECDISNIILQNHATSSALDEYALKTSLDVRNGLLGAENGAGDFACLFFYGFYRGAPSAHQLGIWSHVPQKWVWSLHKSESQFFRALVNSSSAHSSIGNLCGTSGREPRKWTQT